MAAMPRDRKARWTGPMIDAKHLIRPSPPLHTAALAKDESLNTGTGGRGCAVRVWAQGLVRQCPG